MTLPQAIIWDIETFPNCFQFGWGDLHSDAEGMFEFSDRRNDNAAFFNFLASLHANNFYMIGFNSLGFDYPVLHEMILEPDRACAATAYDKAQSIIASQNANRWGTMIWPDQRFLPQIDMYAANHFDNNAKRTSLKALQFAMRAATIEELPFAVGTTLTPEQMEDNARYCMHDVRETKRFTLACQAMLEFRQALVPEYGIEAFNWADTKIGSQIIIKALGDDACYIRRRGQRREPRGTPRTNIVVRDIIFPYIEFKRPECQQVLQAFQNRTIDAAKPGAISDITCELDGFTFYFGVGGVHGSVDRQVIRSDGDWLIIDADVASLYPSIAIENGLYPEHLGQRFVEVYRELRNRRVIAKRAGDKILADALKLALNGTYGNTNNAYSPMYDPQYTMQTTINGQLLLLMLAEELTVVPSLSLIQINTDGVTFRVHKDNQAAVADVCKRWQDMTRLELEYKLYTLMCIRDVNNYLAVDSDGHVKRKGAYDWPAPETPIGTAPSGPRAWHGDASAMVVQQAAEARLVRGEDIAEFVRNHADPFDFMLRAKTPASSKLMCDGVAQQRVSRYYAAVDGFKLTRESPPVEHATPGHYKRKSGITDAEWHAGLRNAPTEPNPVDGFDVRPQHNPDIHTKNKSVYEDRTTTIHARALMCNDAATFDRSRLDFEWYVAEANKLVDCFATESEGHKDLFGRTPGCTGDVLPASGGGVKCNKCDGWFCY